MAQLSFRCGVMSSGKSIEILKAAHNHEAQGWKIVLMTGSADGRSDVGTVVFRIGLHRKTGPISEDLSLFDYVPKINKNDVEFGNRIVAYVLTDEARSLEKHHVLECAKIVDELKIPVMASGSKNDFQNHLFEGSEDLLIFADKIEEMKIICYYCGYKATTNLRINPGRSVCKDGQIQIGRDKPYYPMCHFHYSHPDKQR